MQVINYFKIDILPLELWGQIYDKMNGKELKCSLCVSKEFQRLIYTLQLEEARRKKVGLGDNRFHLRLNLDSSLMRAIKSCQSQAVKYLLKKNDPLIDPNEYCSSPLRTAVANSDSETVQILGADKRTKINCALDDAACKNNVPILKILLASRCLLDSRYKDQTIHDALAEAAYNSCYEAACELLKHYVSGRYSGYNPLTRALTKGDYKLSEALLISGKIKMPPDILKSAVEGNNLDVVSMVLTIPNVDINYDNSSAIRLAILKHKHNIVKLILEHPDAYLDENITSDDPNIAADLRNYFESIKEGKKGGIGQLDPIYLEPIPEQELIFWKENGVMQYFNEQSLSQHIAINDAINPLTRQRIPERIIRKMSTTLTISTNASPEAIKISIPKKIPLGLLVLKMWRICEVIPNGLREVNFYLNYSDKPQRLLGKKLFIMQSLLDLDPKKILCSLPPNFCIEVSRDKEACNQIKLDKIVPYLRNIGISWI